MADVHGTGTEKSPLEALVSLPLVTESLAIHFSVPPEDFYQANPLAAKNTCSLAI